MTRDVLEEKVYRLVRGHVAAWNSHDVGRLTSLFADDGIYGEFGLGRVMLGREEIRRHLIATFAALPDLTVTPTGEPLSSGERVYWKWVMMASHEGEFAGVPVTGSRRWPIPPPSTTSAYGGLAGTPFRAVIRRQYSPTLSRTRPPTRRPSRGSIYCHDRA